MAEGITGQGGRVLFGAVGASSVGVMNAKLTRWRLRLRVRSVDTTGANEYWEQRAAIRADWEIEVQGVIPYQTNRFVLNTNEGSIGGRGLVALAQLPTDTHPYFVGVALAEELEVDSPIDGAMAFTARFVCATGLPPYMNTSPA